MCTSVNIYVCACVCVHLCIGVSLGVYAPSKIRHSLTYLLGRAINYLWFRILPTCISNGKGKPLLVLNEVWFPRDLPCLRGSPLLRVQTSRLVLVVPNHLSNRLPRIYTPKPHDNHSPAHVPSLWYSLYSVLCLAYFLLVHVMLVVLTNESQNVSGLAE